MKPKQPVGTAGKHGPRLINPGTGRLIINTNKSAKMLPTRAALNTLSKGNPSERSFQNYAKLTPSGAGSAMTYQDIIDMGTFGINLRNK